VRNGTFVAPGGNEAKLSIIRREDQPEEAPQEAKRSTTLSSKEEVRLRILRSIGELVEEVSERWRRRRRPVSKARCSCVFHCSATLLSRGSSGLGADNKAWILNRTVRICKAGDHLSCGS
jgi:hypothetical protein